MPFTIVSNPSLVLSFADKILVTDPKNMDPEIMAKARYGALRMLKLTFPTVIGDPAIVMKIALANPMTIIVRRLPARYSVLLKRITNSCANMPLLLSLQVMLPATVLTFITLKPIIPVAKKTG
jgi:hypothetical protein